MLPIRKIQFLLNAVVWAIFSARLVFAAQIVSRDPDLALRDNFYDVAIRGNLAWIVGYYGTILRSQDRGLTWQQQRSATTEALFRLVFRDEKEGWITGAYGTILHTQDSGNSWQRQKAPLEEHLLGLDFIDERNGWAVGSRGTVLITANGGLTWTNYGLSDDITLNDVRFIDSQRGWAVGEFGRIYHSTNGGRSWVKQKSPIEVDFVSGESRSLFRLLLPNPHAAWAFGLDGTILAMQNGGPWKVASPAGTSPRGAKRSHLFAAAAFDGKGWAVGERGALVISSLAKNEWTAVHLKVPPATLNGIAFGTDHLGLIVGNGGLILRSDDNGQHWQQTFLFSRTTEHGVYSTR